MAFVNVSAFFYEELINFTSNFYPTQKSVDVVIVHILKSNISMHDKSLSLLLVWNRCTQN